MSAQALYRGVLLAFALCMPAGGAFAHATLDLKSATRGPSRRV